MLATLTELGPDKFSIYFHRNGKTRGPYILTPEIARLLNARGKFMWSTTQFGFGRLGEQRQYEVRRK